MHLLHFFSLSGFIVKKEKSNGMKKGFVHYPRLSDEAEEEEREKNQCFLYRLIYLSLSLDFFFTQGVVVVMALARHHYQTMAMHRGFDYGPVYTHSTREFSAVQYILPQNIILLWQTVVSWIILMKQDRVDCEMERMNVERHLNCL